MPSASRVASRFLRAKMTANTVRLQKFLHEVEEKLQAFLEDQTDASAQAFIKHVGTTKAQLELTFQDPEAEEGGVDPTVLQGYRALVTVLDTLGKCHDAAHLKEVLLGMGRRTPIPLGMYLSALFENAVDLVTSLDVEIEDHMSVGPYSLLLASSPDEEWDEERVHVAQVVLERLDRLLQRAGFGRFAGGQVQAYPGGELPPSSHAPGPGTLGIYNNSTDTFWMSVRDVPDTLQTMVHETGHRVYYRDLSSMGRRAWEDFFIEFVKHPRRSTESGGGRRQSEMDRHAVRRPPHKPPGSTHVGRDDRLAVQQPTAVEP